jgi:hypothetical protein
LRRSAVGACVLPGGLLVSLPSPNSLTSSPISGAGVAVVTWTRLSSDDGSSVALADGRDGVSLHQAATAAAGVAVLTPASAGWSARAPTGSRST